MSEETQVYAVVEQEPIPYQQRYKIYVVDNTSRMHTIRIGNAVTLTVSDNATIITHENALEFHDVFFNVLLHYEMFSFKNESYALIFKTKDLIGIQIVPEEY